MTLEQTTRPRPTGGGDASGEVARFAQSAFTHRRPIGVTFQPAAGRRRNRVARRTPNAALVPRVKACSVEVMLAGAPR